MKTVFRALLVVLLVLGSHVFLQDRAAEKAKPKALRVLFIGNSLTYYNDMPSMIAAMARSSGLKLEHKTIAFPNFSLEDHWNSKDTRRAVADGKWNFVVMQQGPSAGRDGREVLLRYGRLFADEIRKSGGTPAFYMVWPQTSRAGDFEVVRETYKLAAEETDGLFLPAGEAWLAALRVDRSIQLYSADGFHPAPAGSYLAALVIYEQLYSHAPVGLPSKLRLGSGERIDITSREADVLQRAAKEANEKFRRVKKLGTRAP